MELCYFPHCDYWRGDYGMMIFSPRPGRKQIHTHIGWQGVDKAKEFGFSLGLGDWAERMREEGAVSKTWKRGMAMCRGLPGRTCVEWRDCATCDPPSGIELGYRYLDIIFLSALHLLQIGALCWLNNMKVKGQRTPCLENT